MTKPAIPTAVAVVMALVVSGCIPLGTVGAVDQATATRLSTEVPLYRSTEINGQSYKSLGKLSAWSCDNTLLGGGGDQDQVVAKLRQQAQSIGANGLMDLDCGKSSGGITTGCIASLNCSATAIDLKKTSPD